MPPTSSATITVNCSCGKKLKAPGSAIGKKAKCPGCGNVMRLEIPAHAAAPSAAAPVAEVAPSKPTRTSSPPPPTADDDGLGGLYELAAQEKQARTSGQLDENPRCPKCFTDLAAGAVLCTSCGFDLRTKKKITTTSAGAPPPLQPLGGGIFGSSAPKQKATKARSASSGEGNYALGLLFGVLYSLGGAIVYGIARYFLDDVPFVGWMTGWMVLAIGYLSGMGVDKGYKGGNVFAGLTAAGITLVMVIATRLALIAIVVAPVVKKAMDAAGKDRDDYRVQQMIADEEIKKAGHSPHGVTFEQRNTFETAAENRMKTMTNQEYQAYALKADMHETREELAMYVRDDILKEKKLEPMAASKEDRMKAADEADGRVATMTDAQVSGKLKVYDAQATEKMKAAFAAAAAKNQSDNSTTDDEDGSSKSKGISGSLLGFGIILGLLFLIWLMLPTVIAMLLAYRVAANA